VSHKDSSKGFSIIEAVILIVIVVIIGLGGWWIWKHSHAKNTTTHTQPLSTNRPDNPYVGWKSAASAMAGFSIKYPADWTYSSVMGKDNAEHITLTGNHMQVIMSSYKDLLDTQCDDCIQTLDSARFTVPNVGAVDLKQVTHKLDNGLGQALVLELPNSTYYLPSKSHTGVSTTFRGFSVLDSEQAYQNETAAQFVANPEYKIAQTILKSITY